MDDEPAVTVLRAAPGDWETWRALRLRALEEDPDAFGSVVVDERDLDPATWRSWLEHPCLLARVEGVPVGLGALAERAPGRVEIVAMWVAPEARGHGVGGRILSALLDVARSRGDTVRLWVADGNAARRLYERAGFVPTGERASIRPGSALMKSRMRLP